ncbi:hypothetical protein F4780DRAFT_778788 [Xylariomycetidae sp. FL0641]|nr:hypothetical protein F4780DRAFT_778788 [Xylariomycetidae sp. FL0641]
MALNAAFSCPPDISSDYIGAQSEDDTQLRIATSTNYRVATSFPIAPRMLLQLVAEQHCETDLDTSTMSHKATSRANEALPVDCFSQKPIDTPAPSENNSKPAATSPCSGGGIAPPAWTALHGAEAGPIGTDREASWEDISEGSCALASCSPPTRVGRFTRRATSKRLSRWHPLGRQTVIETQPIGTLDFPKRDDYLRRPEVKFGGLTTALRLNPFSRLVEPKAKATCAVTYGLTDRGLPDFGPPGDPFVAQTADTQAADESSVTDSSSVAASVWSEVRLGFEEWLEDLEGDYFRSHF